MENTIELSAMYGSGARELQDLFDSRRLADRLHEITLHTELDDGDIALIAEQSTVWISTVDAGGWPDVSYKGGVPGFVTVEGRTRIRIPIFDGNGMFRTLGNAADTGRVALLFVDTGRPWRLRVHGTGSVSTEPAEVALHHGAKAVLIVEVQRAFPNCGRSIHVDTEIAPDVPVPDRETPMAEWKRIPIIREALPQDDLDRLNEADNAADNAE